MKKSGIKSPKILYFSRGRGFSHGMYDSLIIKELWKINRNLSILVASYDKGYKYLIGNGFKPFNLGLRQDEELTLKSGLRIWSLIRKFKPDLVVCDEVFIALHITKGLKIPSVLIMHWFFESFTNKHPIIPAVKKANHVIFVDTPEFHTIPPHFDVHLTFVGPIIRDFDYTLKDKTRARRELGINIKDKVILVTPGGRHRDGNKLLRLSVEAFKELKGNNLRMILLAGELYEEYREKFADDKRIIVKDFDWKMDRLMVASDLVICKGTFMTTWELAYLGIPSVSIPEIKNIDQVHVNRMAEHNLTFKIDPQRLNKTVLLDSVKKILSSNKKEKIMSEEVKKLMYGRGPREAAELINYFACGGLK